jgi:hypothetical protein
MDESAVAGSPMDERSALGSRDIDHETRGARVRAGLRSNQSAVAGHSAHSLDPLAALVHVNPLMMLEAGGKQCDMGKPRG